MCQNPGQRYQSNLVKISASQCWSIPLKNHFWSTFGPVNSLLWSTSGLRMILWSSWNCGWLPAFNPVVKTQLNSFFLNSKFKQSRFLVKHCHFSLSNLACNVGQSLPETQSNKADQTLSNEQVNVGQMAASNFRFPPPFLTGESE